MREASNHIDHGHRSTDHVVGFLLRGEGGGDNLGSPTARGLRIVTEARFRERESERVTARSGKQWSPGTEA